MHVDLPVPECTLAWESFLKPWFPIGYFNTTLRINACFSKLAKVARPAPTSQAPLRQFDTSWLFQALAVIAVWGTHFLIDLVKRSLSGICFFSSSSVSDDWCFLCQHRWPDSHCRRPIRRRSHCCTRLSSTTSTHLDVCSRIPAIKPA